MCEYTININALDEVELFKCKSTTESSPTLSLRQYVIRYTGVWLQLKVSPLLDCENINGWG